MDASTRESGDPPDGNEARRPILLQTLAGTRTLNPYTIEDAGCYVDGARGIYATDTIVELAESHGFELEPCDKNDGHEHIEAYFPSRFAGCENSADIEDEATDCMNGHYPVPGASWGRSESGDWGLWEDETE